MRFSAFFAYPSSTANFRDLLTFDPSADFIDYLPTMTSADFWQFSHTLLHGSPYRSKSSWHICQTSPGKSDSLHPMGQCWTSFCLANSSTPFSLICGSCSSGRDFASGFLQIPPRDGHPCLWLVVPTAKPTADFHRQAIAHAGRTTNKKGHGCPWPFFVYPNP